MKQFKKIISMLCAIAMVVSIIPSTVMAQERQKATKIVLNPEREIDNLESLPAGASQHDPAIQQLNYGTPKYFWITNFGERATDTLEWTVQSNLEETTEYYAWMRIQAWQGTEFELSVSQNGEQIDSLTFKHLDDGYSYTQSAWAYDEAGVLDIPAGESTITFRMKSEQSQACCVYGLDMIRNSDKPAYEERVADFRKSGEPTIEKLINQDYGYFFQYGVWGYPEFGAKKDMETATNDFDVDSFVQFLEDTGAKSVIWSITWWEYKMQMNVKAVDEIMGNSDFTTERNLIPEIAEACNEKGIDFYLYYHQGIQQQPEWKAKQNFPDEYTLTGMGDRTLFFDNWKKVISEIGTTLGTNLDGWFFDDANAYYGAPFESLGQAAKKGNDARVISYNGWIGPKVTEFADMAFNEGEWGELKYQPDSVIKDGILQNGKEKGQLYVGMPIATRNNWGIYNPNEKIELSVSPDYMIQRVKATHAQKVPMFINLSMWEDGRVGQSVLDGLMKLKKGMTNEVESAGEVVDDFDSRLTYSSEGGWTEVPDYGADMINGTYHRGTNPAGNPTVEFQFEGIGFEVYGPQATWSANCDVYVDGEKVGSGDFTSSDPSKWTLSHLGFSKMDLEYGEHTVKLVYGKTNANVLEAGLDAIKIYKEPVDSTEDEYPIKKLNIVCDKTEMSPTEQLQMHASIRPEYATNKEVVWNVTDEDGNATDLAEIDENGLLTGKDNGYGKVLVTVTSKENSEIKHSVLITLKKQEITWVNDDDPAIKYVEGSGWDSLGKIYTGYYEDDCHMTQNVDANPTIEYTFTGTGIGVVAAKAPWASKAKVYIDGEEAGEAVFNGTPNAYQAEEFVTRDLEYGEHTIRLVYERACQGTCEAQLDAFKVYDERKEETFPVTEVEILTDETTMKPDGEMQLTATVKPENATNKAVVWSVTDKDGNATELAEIDENGLLKGTNKGDGEVIVTVTSQENSEISDSIMITLKGEPVDPEEPDGPEEPGEKPEEPGEKPEEPGEKPEDKPDQKPEDKPVDKAVETGDTTQGTGFVWMGVLALGVVLEEIVRRRMKVRK